MRETTPRTVPVLVGMPFLRRVIEHKLRRLAPHRREFDFTEIDEDDCIRAWELDMRETRRE